ncbi:MAG: hypothetical protein IKL18_03050 [Oscillospiraceae bacterium]|nr:hypothetical protein [Oscillospiraceae bacterium]
MGGFFRPFFDSSVKEENSGFGRALLRFQMLRKDRLIWHKNKSKKLFLIVKTDGFKIFCWVLGRENGKIVPAAKSSFGERKPFAKIKLN